MSRPKLTDAKFLDDFVLFKAARYELRQVLVSPQGDLHKPYEDLDEDAIRAYRAEGWQVKAGWYRV